MSTTLGSMRRLLLTPSLADVTFARRGFAAARAPGSDRLERIPQSVICGFEWGIDSRDQWEVERRLELVEPELRGFAYEGATMAFTVRDMMAAGRGHRARDLLTGPGRPHLFLAYIGIGFAMARLPRPLWKKVLPDLPDNPYHPTMSWLGIDGYGFDRAYFDTDKWVHQQWRPPAYPWLGRPDYFPRAVDQGIGRALWFIHGGQPADVGAAIRRFATDRQADLWSGIGLAATVAGGCPTEGLRLVRREAGGFGPHLAQGAVFGAKARDEAGFVPAHTGAAVEVFADRSVGSASALADDLTIRDPAGDADYEAWRGRIRAATTAIGVAS
jgi:hypothetical protein